MKKAGAVKRQTVRKTAVRRDKLLRSDRLNSGNQPVNGRKGKTSTLSAERILPGESSDEDAASSSSNAEEEDDDDSSTADTQPSSDDDDDNDEESAADAAPQSTDASTAPRRNDADTAKPKTRNVNPATKARQQVRTQRRNAILAKLGESVPSDTYIVTSMSDDLYKEYAALAQQVVIAIDGPGAQVVCKKWTELSIEDLLCRIVLVIDPKKNQPLNMAAFGPKAADLYSDTFGLAPTTKLAKSLFLPRMLLLAVDSGAMKSALAKKIPPALTPMLSPTADSPDDGLPGTAVFLALDTPTDRANLDAFGVFERRAQDALKAWRSSKQRRGKPAASLGEKERGASEQQQSSDASDASGGADPDRQAGATEDVSVDQTTDDNVEEDEKEPDVGDEPEPASIDEMDPDAGDDPEGNPAANDGGKKEEPGTSTRQDAGDDAAGASEDSDARLTNETPTFRIDATTSYGNVVKMVGDFVELVAAAKNTETVPHLRVIIDGVEPSNTGMTDFGAIPYVKPVLRLIESSEDGYYTTPYGCFQAFDKKTQDGVITAQIGGRWFLKKRGELKMQPVQGAAPAAKREREPPPAETELSDEEEPQPGSKQQAETVDISVPPDGSGSSAPPDIKKKTRRKPADKKKKPSQEEEIKALQARYAELQATLNAALAVLGNDAVLLKNPENKRLLSAVPKARRDALKTDGVDLNLSAGMAEGLAALLAGADAANNVADGWYERPVIHGLCNECKSTGSVKKFNDWVHDGSEPTEPSFMTLRWVLRSLSAVMPLETGKMHQDTARDSSGVRAGLRGRIVAVCWKSTRQLVGYVTLFSVFRSLLATRPRLWKNAMKTEADAVKWLFRDGESLDWSNPALPTPSTGSPDEAAAQHIADEMEAIKVKMNQLGNSGGVDPAPSDGGDADGTGGGDEDAGAEDPELRNGGTPSGGGDADGIGGGDEDADAVGDKTLQSKRTAPAFANIDTFRSLDTKEKKAVLLLALDTWLDDSKPDFFNDIDEANRPAYRDYLAAMRSTAEPWRKAFEASGGYPAVIQSGQKRKNNKLDLQTAARAVSRSLKVASDLRKLTQYVGLKMVGDNIRPHFVNKNRTAKEMHSLETRKKRLEAVLVIVDALISTDFDKLPGAESLEQETARFVLGSMLEPALSAVVDYSTATTYPNWAAASMDVYRWLIETGTVSGAKAKFFEAIARMENTGMISKGQLLPEGSGLLAFAGKTDQARFKEAVKVWDKRKEKATGNVKPLELRALSHINSEWWNAYFVFPAPAPGDGANAEPSDKDPAGGETSAAAATDGDAETSASGGKVPLAAENRAAGETSNADPTDVHTADGQSDDDVAPAAVIGPDNAGERVPTPDEFDDDEIENSVEEMTEAAKAAEAFERQRNAAAAAEGDEGVRRQHTVDTANYEVEFERLRKKDEARQRQEADAVAAAQRTAAEQERAEAAKKRRNEQVMRLRQEADAVAAANRTAAEQKRAEAATKRLEEQAAEAEKRQREQEATQKRLELAEQLKREATERAARDEAARKKAAKMTEQDERLKVSRDKLSARLSAGADPTAKETAARAQLEADRNLVRFVQTSIHLINESNGSPDKNGLLQLMTNVLSMLTKDEWRRWGSGRALTHYFDDFRTLLRAAMRTFTDKSQDELDAAIQQIVVSEISGLDAASFDENVDNGLSPSPAASPQTGTGLPRRLDRTNPPGAGPAFDVPLRGNDMREAGTPQQRVWRTDSLFKQEARTEDERQQQMWTIAGASADKLTAYAKQAKLTFPLLDKDGGKLKKNGMQSALWAHLGLAPPYLEDVYAKLDSADQGYTFTDLSNILSWSNYKTVKQQSTVLAALNGESPGGVQPSDRKLAMLKNWVKMGLKNAGNAGIFLPSKARTSE